MHELEAWLQKPDFDTGATLYERYGSNSGLKFLFSLGQTVYSFEKLKEGIREAWENLPAESEKRPEGPNLPSSIQDIINEDLALYEQGKRLFERSKSKTISTEERKECAKLIKQIFREKAILYAQVLEFRETGKLPAKQGFDVRNATDSVLLRRHRTLSSYFAPSKSGKVKDLDAKRAELEAIKLEIEFRGI